MRRVVLLAVLLAGCATPAGEERLICDAQWLDVASVATRAKGIDERAVPIECYRRVAHRRVRLGFTLPAGPDCWHLSRIDRVESADAASLTVFVARDENALAGACAEEPTRRLTELDLQAPIGDRVILDGFPSHRPSSGSAVPSGS